MEEWKILFVLVDSFTSSFSMTWIIYIEIVSEEIKRQEKRSCCEEKEKKIQWDEQCSKDASKVLPNFISITSICVFIFEWINLCYNKNKNNNNNQAYTCMLGVLFYTYGLWQWLCWWNYLFPLSGQLFSWWRLILIHNKHLS